MLYLWIFFGGGLAWLIALGQLIHPKHLKNRVLSLLLFCSGYWQLYLALLYSNQIIHYPYLFNTMAAFVFFTGPLFYLYFTIVFQESYQFKKIWYLHFLPGLIAGSLLLWNSPSSTEIQLLRQKQQVGSIQNFLLLALTIDSVYVILLMKKFSHIWKIDYFKNKQMVHVLLFIIATLIIAFLFLICVWIEYEPLGKFCATAVTVLFIYMYMIYEKYPQMIRFLKEENNKKKYEKTQIGKLNLQEIRQKLNQAMLEEKMFCDEDISLKNLAEQIGITSHQLSEFLNIHLQTNFKSYIKSYRIAEAQKILLEEQNRTTLSIGFAVGFNSNSAFHAAFRSATGLTPNQYRKQHNK